MASTKSVAKSKAGRSAAHRAVTVPQRHSTTKHTPASAARRVPRRQRPVGSGKVTVRKLVPKPVTATRKPPVTAKKSSALKKTVPTKKPASGKRRIRQTAPTPPWLQLLPWLLVMLLGIGLIAASVGWWFYQQTILSFKVAPTVTAQLHLRAAKPVAITIPRAMISLPVVESQIVNGLWQTADHQANFLGSGARPAEGSNTVIYAHNRVGMFRNLHTVSIGDQIMVTNEKNEVLTYTAKEIHTVTPDQIAVVLPTDHEQLTLYTCTGWLDRFRLVVVAEPTPVASTSALFTR